jgi:hypothetical protein
MEFAWSRSINPPPAHYPAQLTQFEIGSIPDPNPTQKRYGYRPVQAVPP